MRRRDNITNQRTNMGLRKYIHYLLSVGPGSVVGIATAYGLDGPVIGSRWGREFPHPYRPVLSTTQSPVQWVPGLSRG